MDPKSIAPYQEAENCCAGSRCLTKRNWKLPGKELYHGSWKLLRKFFVSGEKATSSWQSNLKFPLRGSPLKEAGSPSGSFRLP